MEHYERFSFFDRELASTLDSFFKVKFFDNCVVRKTPRNKVYSTGSIADLALYFGVVVVAYFVMKINFIIFEVFAAWAILLMTFGLTCLLYYQSFFRLWVALLICMLFYYGHLGQDMQLHFFEFHVSIYKPMVYLVFGMFAVGISLRFINGLLWGLVDYLTHKYYPYTPKEVFESVKEVG